MCKIHNETMRYLKICSVALFLVLAGCDSGGADAPIFGGQYEMIVRAPTNVSTFDLSLSASGGDVAGDGTVLQESTTSEDAQSYDVSVLGSHDPPRLNLRIQIQDRTATFTGEAQGPDFSGTFTFPGGQEEAATLEAD